MLLYVKMKLTTCNCPQCPFWIPLIPCARQKKSEEKEIVNPKVQALICATVLFSLVYRIYLVVKSELFEDCATLWLVQ